MKITIFLFNVILLFWLAVLCSNNNCINYGYHGEGDILICCQTPSVSSDLIWLALERLQATQTKVETRAGLSWWAFHVVSTMPVFYTPIPHNLRVGLAHVSGSVFINNRTRDSGDFRDPYQDNEGETSAKDNANAKDCTACLCHIAQVDLDIKKC